MHSLRFSTAKNTLAGIVNMTWKWQNSNTLLLALLLYYLHVVKALLNIRQVEMWRYSQDNNDECRNSAKKKKKGSDLDLHLELGVRPNPRTDEQ